MAGLEGVRSVRPALSRVAHFEPNTNVLKELCTDITQWRVNSLACAVLDGGTHIEIRVYTNEDDFAH